MTDALRHLTETFATAERWHSDLMEPYSTRLGVATYDAERMAIMRAGLRETFRRRYPMPDGFYDQSPVAPVAP